MKRAPLPAPLDARAASLPPRLSPPPAPDPGFVAELKAAGLDVTTADAARVEAGRDWWPLATWWAVEGRAPALPAAVCRPRSAGEVSTLMRICHAAGVAVTPFAGQSGVCGGSVPLHGGVSVDLTGLAGIVSIDDRSLVVDVQAGTFGPDLEGGLRAAGFTLGHWPQSVELSTVGGWLACRGAGQYSTRYGKIEDMVAGLDVVMADGRTISTGDRGPRMASGPDLTQLFVGSEGTLGIITGARLRVRRAPPAERRAAYRFAGFDAGLEACRRVLQRGATPAVLRLYDAVESARQFEIPDACVLVVVDEGDPAIVGATMAIVAEECAAEGAATLGEGPAGRWLERRNHIPPVADLVRGGLVADTVEIAAGWSSLAAIYHEALARLAAVEGTLAASAHQSHAYPDGACLYFTFAGRPGAGLAPAEAYYRAAFDAVTAATVEAGGAVSHHHGIGLNRGRYLRGAMGTTFEVLQSVKDALDPGGILNPGKLGLADRFGSVAVP